MTIRAQIIADSVSAEGHRLTTFQLRYPRFIHAEVMTHRVFSRNASSSRAIPVERLIQDVIDDPAMPVFWGANQKGMQARAELDSYGRHICFTTWLDARNEAITRVRRMVVQGLHKQIANRILEPWAHINVVVTSTSWANWYALRNHPDAQPEIQVLAQAMWQAHQESRPVELDMGQWHLPYITERDISWVIENVDDNESGWYEIWRKVSVARCARVSYLTHDGKETTVEKDQELYEQLVGSSPLHASPAEHQATPDDRLSDTGEWKHPAWHGNFEGWIQLRKLLPGEYVADQPYSNPVPQTLVAAE